MKNRAQRRKDSAVVYKRRIKFWTATTDSTRINPTGSPTIPEPETHFLKRTGTPCSCFLCQGERYKRVPKHVRTREE
jgi:hypothetical protein